MPPEPEPDPTPKPPGKPASDEFQAITSQEDLDRIIRERVRRERAKFGDYDDLKTKAARLDKIEEANKSELQKAAEERAEAEKARDAAIVEGLRYRIASKHGITDEDAELFLTGLDEQTLEAQARRLADREMDLKRTGTRSPKEGRTPPKGADELRDFTRGLFSTT